MMPKVHYDYAGSGLSTPDAIEAAKAEVRRHYGPWARFFTRIIAMTMKCDGMLEDGLRCQAIVRTNGKLDEGKWGRSRGWVHFADLDFCLTCQKDGSMQRSVAAGKKPSWK